MTHFRCRGKVQESVPEPAPTVLLGTSRSLAELGWDATWRVLVTLTRQLVVVVHLEPRECSHLAELGWDATFEANRQVRVSE